MSSKKDFLALPDVAIDKIISYLPDEDLRSVHQVSTEWQRCLEIRQREDLRRRNLVEKIRLNKENIMNVNNLRVCSLFFLTFTRFY